MPLACQFLKVNSFERCQPRNDTGKRGRNRAVLNGVLRIRIGCIQPFDLALYAPNCMATNLYRKKCM